MPETSVRIMNMVRRTLFEQPETSDRTLYAAAVALDPAIAQLSLQQFQARYPRHVRRQELGERRSHLSEPAPERELPLDERPYVYAPGSSTLDFPQRKPTPSVESAPEPAAGEPKRGVRRRIQGSRLLESMGLKRESPTAAKPVAEMPAPSAEAASPAPTDDESKTTPWPLRFQPEAASIEPARHPRVSRKIELPQPSPRPAAAASTASARTDELQRLREDTRRVLLEWAVELSKAETPGEIVSALTGVGTHVDAIEALWTRGEKRNGVRTERAPSSAASPASPPPRPLIPRRKNIRDYKRTELDALVRWVMQTVRHRNDDELVDAVFNELAFQRRGKRIRGEIETAIGRVRRRL